MCEDRLDELVGAGDVVKAVLRDRIHDTWIMCIESDEVLHAHRMKLLEHHRAVEGLTSGTLVLAGLIHERHDDIDALRLAGRRCDDALQITVVIIRGHVVHLAEQAVGLCIVHDVNHQIQIHATYGLEDVRLRLTGAEAGHLRLYDIAVLLVTVERDGLLVITLTLGTPCRKILIDLLAQWLDRIERHQRQWSHRDTLNKL